MAQRKERNRQQQLPRLLTHVKISLPKQKKIKFQPQKNQWSKVELERNQQEEDWLQRFIVKLKNFASLLHENTFIRRAEQLIQQFVGILKELLQKLENAAGILKQLTPRLENAAGILKQLPPLHEIINVAVKTLIELLLKSNPVSWKVEIITMAVTRLIELLQKHENITIAVSTVTSLLQKLGNAAGILKQLTPWVLNFCMLGMRMWALIGTEWRIPRIYHKWSQSMLGDPSPWPMLTPLYRPSASYEYDTAWKEMKMDLCSPCDKGHITTFLSEPLKSNPDEAQQKTGQTRETRECTKMDQKREEQRQHMEETEQKDREEMEGKRSEENKKEEQRKPNEEKKREEKKEEKPGQWKENLIFGVVVGVGVGLLILACPLTAASVVKAVPVQRVAISALITAASALF